MEAARGSEGRPQEFHHEGRSLSVIQTRRGRVCGRASQWVCDQPAYPIPMDPTESDRADVPGAVADSGRPEAAEETAASALGRIDPIAVGGAVGGMTAGEVIGGAIGGLIGAVAGPGGVAIGAGLGAFAGTSIGANDYRVARERRQRDSGGDRHSSHARRRRGPGRRRSGENTGREGGNRGCEASQVAVFPPLETEESHQDASGRGPDPELPRILKPRVRAGANFDIFVRGFYNESSQPVSLSSGTCATLESWQQRRLEAPERRGSAACWAAFRVRHGAPKRCPSRSMSCQCGAFSCWRRQSACLLSRAGIG